MNLSFLNFFSEAFLIIRTAGVVPDYLYLFAAARDVLDVYVSGLAVC